MKTLTTFINTVEDNEVLETPLHDASKRGNIGFLEECLMNGVSCNACLNLFVKSILIWENTVILII